MENKYWSKNKLIILDNVRCLITKIIKDSIRLNNNLLYKVLYNSRTKAIEGFFNILKSRLKQNNNNLSYTILCLNIQRVISEISKFFYLNLIKGAYKKRYTKYGYF